MSIKALLLSLRGKMPPRLQHLGTNYNMVHDFYKDAQWWGKEKIEEWQLKRLQHMISYAYENTDGYHQLYDEAYIKPSDIQRLDDITVLPFTTKELIRENIDKFTVSKDVAGRLFRKSTGGSTGKPFVFFADTKNAVAEYGFMYNAWESIGWKESDIGVTLRGKYVGDPNNLIVKTGYNRYAISSIYITEENYSKYIQAIQNTKVSFIHCYPSSLIEFAKLVVMHNDSKQLESIKHLFVSSEALYEWQKEIIRKAFPNAKIMHWYGHGERAVWAPWCENNEKFHINPFYGYCEIIDGTRPVSIGETGEIVGTSFWMNGTLFIRYRTKDFATRGADRCELCGREFKLIDKIEGRLQEYLVGRDGRKISISVWDCHFMHGKIFEHIEHFRFIQYEFGKLQLAIVPSAFYTEEEEKMLLQELNDFFGLDFEVEIKHVKELSKTKAGKFSLVEQHLTIE